MADRVDLAVIGAGPAGMAAAVTAADLGLDTTVVDEQAAPGGQVWRGIEAVVRDRPDDLGRLGPFYAAGLAPVRRFRAAAIDYRPGTTVWRIDPDGGLLASRSGRGLALRARAILMATGAMERPVPVPGWTRPGVMTAGGIQGLLKLIGAPPAGPILLYGTGPLLLQLAVQLLAFGVKPTLLTPPSSPWAGLTAWSGVLGGPQLVLKGLGFLATLRRAGIRPITVTEPVILGEGADGPATALEARVAGERRRFPAGTVGVHDGVVPHPQAARLLGVPERWNPIRACFEPVLDPFGRTGETLWIAGDGAGVAGWEVAVERGRLAALGIAHALGRIGAADRDGRATRHRRRVRRLLGFRRFLDARYPPAAAHRRPADPVTICRCEGVTAGEVRAAAALGCPGPNQAKAWLRCGMGPCQGRQCALTVTEVLADALGRPQQAIGSYRVRPPLVPVTLGELADTASDAADLPLATPAAGPTG